MADKIIKTKIKDLPQATSIADNDIFIGESLTTYIAICQTQYYSTVLLLLFLNL